MHLKKQQLISSMNKSLGEEITIMALTVTEKQRYKLIKSANIYCNSHELKTINHPRHNVWQSIAARMLIKLAARDTLYGTNKCIKDIQILRHKSGRPYIKIRQEFSKLTTSISHSRNKIAIVISRSGLPVGIDIEHINSCNWSVIRGFFHLPETMSESDMLNWWVVRESCIKASCDEISLLDNLKVSKRGSRESIDLYCSVDSQGNYYNSFVRMFSGFAIALSIKSETDGEVII